MVDRRVSVGQVNFTEFEGGVKEILDEYYRWLEKRARSWLEEQAARGREEFAELLEEADFEAYVDAQFETDVDYLTESAPDSPLILARARGDIVGCVYLYHLTETTGEVRRLYVSPQYRECGLGRELMENLIDLSAMRGYTLLRLDTAPYMEAAQNLYRSLGFEETSPHESVSNVPEPLRDEFTYMRLSGLDEGADE